MHFVYFAVFGVEPQLMNARARRSTHSLLWQKSIFLFYSLLSSFS